MVMPIIVDNDGGNRAAYYDKYNVLFDKNIGDNDNGECLGDCEDGSGDFIDGWSK